MHHVSGPFLMFLTMRMYSLLYQPRKSQAGHANGGACSVGGSSLMGCGVLLDIMGQVSSVVGRAVYGGNVDCQVPQDALRISQSCRQLGDWKCVVWHISNGVGVVAGEAFVGNSGRIVALNVVSSQKRRLAVARFSSLLLKPRGRGSQNARLSVCHFEESRIAAAWSD